MPPTTDERREKPGPAAFHEALLLELSDTLRSLADPAAIQEQATRILGRRLGVSRALYAEFVIEGDQGYVVIEQEQHTPGMGNVVGRQPADQFGPDVAGLRAGRVIAVSDTEAELAADDEREVWRALGVRARLGVPLIKDGRLLAGVGVHDASPRAWTDEEIALLLETGERTWAAVARARAEAALRESEEKYRTLFETMGQGYCELQLLRDADGRAVDQLYLELNPAYERLIGIPAAKAKGRTAGEVMPQLAPWWTDAFDRIARHGEPERIEHEIAFLGRWYEVFVYPRSGDRLTVLYADITDRKRAEAAFRESEHRLRAIFDGTYEYIGLLSPDGTLLEANRASLEFAGESFGGQREDVVGRPFWETVWFVNTPGAAETLRAAIVRAARGEFIRYDAPLCRPSGEVLVFDCSLHPIRNEAGEVTLIVPEGRNVTELRRAEDALRRAKDEAEAASAALREADHRKNEFLATLAHELRNPLAPLRSALHVLKLAGGGGPTGDHVRDIMERQLGQMVRLIDDLLDVSRISQGKFELRKERAALAAIVQQAIETSQPAIEAGGHELTVQLPAEPIYLQADVTRLAQVFANLLNNAAKYTERGGQIRLSAELRGGEAVVSVRDTGIGIPAAMLESVFELFTQVDRSLERSRSGLGIGLTLVKRLVEMHDGRIEAQSEGEGMGSEFIVRLPLAPA